MGSDEAAIVKTAVDDAMAHQPHQRAIRWLTAAITVLSVIAVGAAVLGVRSVVAQAAATRCQSSLLENLSAQSAAGDESREQLRAAAQSAADAAVAQAADLEILLDPSASVDDRRVAANDFRVQTLAAASAWAAYRQASVDADMERAKHPTAFHC